MNRIELANSFIEARGTVDKAKASLTEAERSKGVCESGKTRTERALETAVGVSDRVAAALEYAEAIHRWRESDRAFKKAQDAQDASLRECDAALEALIASSAG